MYCSYVWRLEDHNHSISMGRTLGQIRSYISPSTFPWWKGWRLFIRTLILFRRTPNAKSYHLQWIVLFGRIQIPTCLCVCRRQGHYKHSDITTTKIFIFISWPHQSYSQFFVDHIKTQAQELAFQRRDKKYTLLPKVFMDSLDTILVHPDFFNNKYCILCI